MEPREGIKEEMKEEAKEEKIHIFLMSFPGRMGYNAGYERIVLMGKEIRPHT